VLGKRPKLIRMGIKAAAAEVAAIDTEAIAAESSAWLPSSRPWAVVVIGALTMALAEAAAPEDSLRECWLARERLRVSEGRSIGRAKILTARTDAAAEAAKVAAAEAAAAEVFGAD
jgi:hypothetical protein